MNIFTSTLKELLGLFVDDGSMALHILILILGIALLVEALGVAPLIGGGLLIVGCLAILAFSLRRKARS